MAYTNKRDSVIVYPYVDTEFWKPTIAKEDYFFIAGRLQPYKGHDLVIKACNELGLPLHVVGTGRYENYLHSIAGPTVKFLGRVSDEQLRDEYSGARGFLYPQLEDCGMMPLEAAACGTATIGLAKGGSLETIVPGVSGELIDQITVESLKTALMKWDERRYQTEQMREHAEKFSKQEFKRKVAEFIHKVSDQPV
jgi:glycosyltransferase involved in cell wall biosynthesis